MFLKIWIISTIICCVLFYTVVFSVNTELKKIFTKEELEEYKRKKDSDKYAWYVYVFVFMCPFLNIIFILIAGFAYGELKDSVIYDVKLKLDKLTAIEKLVHNIGK